MKPADLPDPETYPHGTRARYVGAKCRCTECRAANTQYARDRATQAKQRALQASTGSNGTTAPQIWTAPDGTKRTRLYRRACTGIHGQPCPHGSHLRKDSTGDICHRCREALDFRGLVPSDRARTHLLDLSKQGVGNKSVALACDVSSAILWNVRIGITTQIRIETERRILAVDHQAIADGAIVNGRRTHRAIVKMQRMGLTKTEIAERLGNKTRPIQLKPRVLARTELRVLRLLAEVLAAAKEHAHLPTICPHCGLSHETADRQRVLGRMLPAVFEDVHAAWPCLYADTAAGQKRFYRDRRAIQEQP